MKSKTDALYRETILPLNPEWINMEDILENIREELILAAEKVVENE